MFDVYAGLPGFNKKLLVAENVTAAEVGDVMARDETRQLAEDKRYGGYGGPYASWTVQVHDSEAGRSWRDSESTMR